MLISIIDDNNLELNLISDLVNREVIKYTNHYQIDKLNDPIKLDFQKNYDIVFLDIEMPKDGIDLAREYLAVHKFTYIIFITNHDDRVFNALDIHPYHFIRKSELEKLVPYVIASLMNKLKIENNLITIKTEIGFVELKLEEIKYIKSDKHYCIITTITNTYRVREKLNNLETYINHQDFCRIHNTTIVNWQYVDKYEIDMIKIEKEYFSISKSKSKSVQKSHLDYISRLI